MQKKIAPNSINLLLMHVFAQISWTVREDDESDKHI